MGVEFLKTFIVLILHCHIFLYRVKFRGCWIKVSFCPRWFNQVSKRIVNKSDLIFIVILKEALVQLCSLSLLCTVTASESVSTQEHLYLRGEGPWPMRRSCGQLPRVEKCVFSGTPISGANVENLVGGTTLYNCTPSSRCHCSQWLLTAQSWRG